MFYVWFDAPIEYIGATKEWADVDPEARDWRSWWFDANDVRYTQFMGKDNIPFHTINFPITIMGTGEPWKLVDYVKGFNYLTYYGGKFSTSQQRGIFMDAAIELLPADYWRYALLAAAPESDDTEFTWESFALTVNKDLAGIFGNFVQRTLKLTEKLFGPTVPDGGEPGPEEAELAVALDAALATYATEMDAMRFRPSAFALREPLDAGQPVPRPLRPVARDRHGARRVHPAHGDQRGADRGNRLGAVCPVRVRAPGCDSRPHRRRALVAGSGERRADELSARSRPGVGRGAVSEDRRPQHPRSLGGGDGAALRRAGC